MVKHFPLKYYVNAPSKYNSQKKVNINNIGATLAILIEVLKTQGMFD